MIPIFQQSPSDQSRRARARLEDALAMIIQECSDRQFTRLFDAIDEMKFIDPVFYCSMRGHYLTKSLFDAVDSEDRYRRTRSMQGWGSR